MTKSPLSSQPVLWTDVPPNLAQLAAKMKVEVVSYGVIPGWLNACTDLRGTIRIGDKMLQDLTADELDAVFAHELGHTAWFRSEQAQWAFLFSVLMYRRATAWANRQHPLLIALCWREILDAFSAMLFPVRWAMEFGADSVAAAFIGREKVVLMLRRLRQLQGDSDAPSLTHPPMAFRIVRLSV